MCGIIAAFGAGSVERVQAQYDKQKNRGLDGFGFLALRNSRIVKYERTMSHAGIEKKLAALGKVDALLFHHRMPTVGLNVPEMAHPIKLQHKSWKHTYYILHNGVMSHTEKQYYEILDAGYRFTTSLTPVSWYQTASGKLYSEKGTTEVNDSEVLGYYIAEMLEGKITTIPLYGAIACIIVREAKNGVCEVFALRNDGNPLIETRGENTLMLSSEGAGMSLRSEVLWKVNGTTVANEGYCDAGLSYRYDSMGYSASGTSKTLDEWRENDAGRDNEREYTLDFTNDYGISAQLARLEGELASAHDEEEFWSDELRGASGAERQAILEECHAAEAKVEKLEDKLRELENMGYGAKDIA